MMKYGRLIPVLSLITNFFIFAITVFSVSLFFVAKGQGNMEVVGAKCFKYFTVDSNILAALASAAVAAFQLKNIISGRLAAKGALPEWLRIFKFVSAASVMLTFLTVVFFLGPMMGYGKMFEGTNLFLHLTTPLAALVSLLFLESGARIAPGLFILGVVPMLLYGTVYVSMVVFVRKWQDFYMFNVSGVWWISALIMTAATAAIAFGIGYLANIISKNLIK